LSGVKSYRKMRRRILARLLRVKCALSRLDEREGTQEESERSGPAARRPALNRQALELLRETLEDRLLELQAGESRKRSGQESQRYLVEIWDTLSEGERDALRRSDDLRETRDRLIDEEWRAS
jgi:hypothetical protein